MSNIKINSGDYIQSIERGLSVIQAFSEEHPKLTVSQASQKTGLSRPAVRRIMLTLQYLGFATSKEGYFSLTAKVLSLGYAFLSSQNMWNFAYPRMQGFVAKSGESCSISVLDDTHIVYVARVPAKRIMNVNINVGTRFPAYATSMGRVLLSAMHDVDLQDYLENTLFTSITDKTIIDKQELLSIIKETGQLGFAHIEGQLEQGLRSLAVPIYNQNEEIIGAINCSVHAGRVSKEDLLTDFLPLLRKTSQDISQDVFFKIDPV